MSSTPSDVTPKPASFRFKFWFCLASLCWLCISAGGFWVLLAYENRPGSPAAAPSQWPIRTALTRAPDRPTLVMLVHPHCTCTRASLGELAEVLARTERRPKTYVVFLKPEGFSDGWEQTDLWQTASALPEVTVLRDDRGLEAERFGAATSGQTLLYDASGTLLFSGGITGARAHPGDNVGRQTLLDHLAPAGHLAHDATTQAQAATGEAHTSVFGCPLFASTN